MGFVSAAFGSPNGEVRMAAVKVALEVYKKVGKAAERFLPKTLKPAIKDVLTQGFDQIEVRHPPAPGPHDVCGVAPGPHD
eukprot:7930728-Pyramimonas_sp.AAC.1